MSKIVLGKGLDALIPVSSGEKAQEPAYPTVSLDRIAPNPMQPRQSFDDDRLAELAESFRTNGILQPLVVKKNGSAYTIIAGERRFRAAHLAGLGSVPVVIMDNVDDVRMLELALVENIHRKDLNPIELAEAYRRLIEQCQLTQQVLSSRVGKSRAAVTNALRLLSLPNSVQTMVRAGKLSEGHARAILSLDSDVAMERMAEQIVAGRLSVRDTESTTRRRKTRRLIPKRNHPAVGEIETKLKQILGTSVKIVPGLKRSRIEIEYYGDEDLSRIWELLRTVRVS